MLKQKGLNAKFNSVGKLNFEPEEREAKAVTHASEGKALRAKFQPARASLSQADGLSEAPCGSASALWVVIVLGPVHKIPSHPAQNV